MAKSRFDLKFVIIIAIIPIINGVPLDLKSIGSNWTTEDVGRLSADKSFIYKLVLS